MGNKITSRPHLVSLLSFTLLYLPPVLKVHCSCFFFIILNTSSPHILCCLITYIFLFRQIRLQIKQDKKSTTYCSGINLSQMGYVFVTSCAHCALCKQTKEVQIMGVVHTRERESLLLYHLDKMALPVC